MCIPFYSSYHTQIARKGSIKFTREALKEQGVVSYVKKRVTREGLTLMKCQGIGMVLCADHAKVVCMKVLVNSSLSVNGNDVLALSSTLKRDIRMNNVGAMLSGGPFNVKVRIPPSFSTHSF